MGKCIEKVTVVDTKIENERHRLDKIDNTLDELKHVDVAYENKLRGQQEILDELRKNFLGRVARVESELVAAKSTRTAASLSNGMGGSKRLSSAELEDMPVAR